MVEGGIGAESRADTSPTEEIEGEVGVGGGAENIGEVGGGEAGMETGNQGIEMGFRWRPRSRAIVYRGRRGGGEEGEEKSRVRVRVSRKEKEMEFGDEEEKPFPNDSHLGNELN